MEETLVLFLFVVCLVVLAFHAYLWILLARLMRLGCKFLRAQLDYYHASFEDEN